MPNPIVVAVITFDHFSPFHCAVPCLIFGDTMMPGASLFELRLCAGDATRRPVPPRAFASTPAMGWRGWSGLTSSSSPSGAIRPSDRPSPCSMP